MNQDNVSIASENIDLKNSKRLRHLKINELYFKERKDAITAYDQVIQKLIIADQEGDASVANKKHHTSICDPNTNINKAQKKKPLNHDHIETIHHKLHPLTTTLY